MNSYTEGPGARLAGDIRELKLLLEELDGTMTAAAHLWEGDAADEMWRRYNALKKELDSAAAVLTDVTGGGGGAAGRERTDESGLPEADFLL